MSTKRKLFMQLCTMLLTVPFLVLALATSANADSVPSTQWSPTAIGDIPNASQVLTNVDGGATVGCGSYGYTTSFKTFSASGQVTQDVASGTPDPTFCSGQSAVGPDGTVFVYAWQQHDPIFQAYKDNDLVWTYKPNCGSYLRPYSMAVAANGNLYIATVEGSSSYTGCGSNMIIGLTPTAKSGTSEPNVVLKKKLSGGYISSGGLAVYEDGFALHMGNNVKYIDMSGNTVSTSASFTLATAGTGYGDQFDATMDGRTFLPIRASSSASTGCQWPDNVSGHVKAIDPDGSVAWSTQLQGCTYIYDLRPAPWGGVVVYARWNPVTGGGLQDRLIAFDANGDQMWSTTFNNADLANWGSAIAVDLNGNVAVRRNVMVGKRINGSYWKFPEVRFVLLSGYTGTAIPGTRFMLRGDSSTSDGPSYQWGGSEARIAKNTAYVTAMQCTNSPNCDYSTTKLYAFKVPGLEMDYPRGAILQADRPWKNYVAMGDSFSSGEGVEPFTSPSDSNGCHRSEKAYPELLDGNAAVRLNLVAFVACSGAEISHIKGGKNGEDPQLSTLNSQTDIITIGVGGNDADFREFVLQCLFLDCSENSAKQHFFDKVSDLGDELGDIYNRILTNAPNADVYVLGYPVILPNPDVCPDPLDAGVAVLDTAAQAASDGNGPALAAVRLIGEKAGLSDNQVQALIDAGEVKFTRAEIETANSLTEELNGQINHSVMSKLSSRLKYIDATVSGSPFTGHELCTNDTFFNGVDLLNPEYSFHPNMKGQDAYRRLIEDYL